MSYKPLFIEIHALQTVPPSNINRDDTGSPKTARFGGFTRARVSSQAWKKAIRDEFANTLDVSELGQRTKRAVYLIASYIQEIEPTIVDEQAVSMAASALQATGVKVAKDNATGYLLFISPMQARGLAKLAVEAQSSDAKIDSKLAKKVINVRESPTLNAIDIALFGRMVADDPSLNVDAAVQVAHAIGVSRSETEYDYFTALDDRSPEDNAGAAMIETTEFLSSTLYRYATIDVYHLCENLGSYSATRKAIQAFIRAFVTSMPTGKQNSFANRTLPSALLVQTSSCQPVNLSIAFERPVYPTEDKGILEIACERLLAQERRTRKSFGMGAQATFAIAGGDGAECLEELNNGESVDMDIMLNGIDQEVERYLMASDLPSGAEEE